MLWGFVHWLCLCMMVVLVEGCAASDRSTDPVDPPASIYFAKVPARYGPGTETPEQCQAIEHETLDLRPRIDEEGTPAPTLEPSSQATLTAISDALGDQRAEDLVDVSDNVIDHQCAIRLITTALGFGTGSIQAAKAYGYRARRYAFIGETAAAIDDYSRAIEVSARHGVNTSGLLYKRAHLYAAWGAIEPARQDYERALATDNTPPHWFPEDRRQAEDFLRSLR